MILFRRESVQALRYDKRPFFILGNIKFRSGPAIESVVYQPCRSTRISMKASDLVRHRFGKYNKQERIANILRDAKRLVMTIEKYQSVQKWKGRGGRNPWNEHLMLVHARTGLPLKEAMRVASRSWRRRDG